MHTATVELKSVSPYSQSRYHATDKLDKEQPKDYESRTWKERCHFTKQGEIFIPPMAFKNCIAEAAKYLGIKIPGKGNNNYTKHIEAGVLVVEPVLTGVFKDDVIGEWLFLPSDGRRGGGKRVMKCYPRIDEWQGVATFNILDDTITEDVFLHHLTEAGRFIGLGRFRPRNNGFYGRFEIVKCVWE